MRRFRLASVLVALLVGAVAIAIPAAGAQNEESTRQYRVTVHNLTSGQPLTPPVFAGHNHKTDLFRLNEPALAWVREIAENGNVGPLANALPQTRGVKVSGVASSDAGVMADGMGPIGPGGSRSWTFEAPAGAKRISFVSMIVCTNDGITGLNSRRLPRNVGDSIERPLKALDAGTEMNTEDKDDLVPPCSGGAGGTGVSNPALVEGGVVTRHDGIIGGADLDPAVYGWTGPVGRVVIERIG